MEQNQVVEAVCKDNRALLEALSDSQRKKEEYKTLLEAEAGRAEHWHTAYAETSKELQVLREAVLETALELARLKTEISGGILNASIGSCTEAELYIACGKKAMKISTEQGAIFSI